MPSLQLGASLLDLFAVRVTARGITVGPVCVVITARGIDVGPVCRHYSPGINVFTCLPSGLLLGALISSCFLSLFFIFYFILLLLFVCFVLTSLPSLQLGASVLDLFAVNTAQVSLLIDPP